MVGFFVHSLGEHCISNMDVSGPCREIVIAMRELFLATYSGPPEADLDLALAQHIIAQAYGQGRILEYTPEPLPPPQ